MSEVYLGALTGTSMNSIDAALFDFRSSPPQLLAHHALSFPELLQEKLQTLSRQPCSLPEFALTEHALSQCFVQCINTLITQAGIAKSEIAAAGVHGQTLLHQGGASPRTTLQLLDPNLINAQCGLNVVSDFRRRDLAEGGEGAPLAPLIHQLLFHDASEDRAVVNIGGIANITFLPAAGAISGFDSGPGGALMDEWCQLHQGDAFDREGQWARAGDPNESLLEAMLKDPYFDQPPPKSTGREYFSRDWLEGLISSYPSDPDTVQSTLAELTARSIADAVSTAPAPVQTVLVCGGNARNLYLMERLDALLDATVAPSDNYGLDAEWVECCLFAWLARQRMHAEALDLTDITGSANPAIAGALWPA